MSEAKRAVVEVLPEGGEDRSPLREVLSKPVGSAPTPQRLEGVIIGSLTGWDESGKAMVMFPGNPAGHPVAAVSITPLEGLETGAAVALLFEACDPTRPVIVGPIQSPKGSAEEAYAESDSGTADPDRVELDGEQLVFSAEKEIVLRCGKASITLTRAGKVLIKGAYLLNRSSGVNRIKGGSVQIN